MMRMSLFCLLFFTTQLVFSQSVVRYEKTDRLLDLSPYVFYLADTTPSLTFKQVQKLPHAAFVQNKKSHTKAQSASKKPVSIIFDTDIGPDYDDVGAMAIMHALADKGEANILATIACNQSKYAAATMSVINTYFGRPNIPVGITRNVRSVNISAWQKWDSVLVARYPSKIKNNNQAQDALTLYRKTLAAQPDKSVTVITVGFLSNLNDLLKSPADKISPLTGMALVKRKVKRLVSMAGRFPKASEYNIQCDPISAKYVVENWPTEVIFSGWEIGNVIHTGLHLINNQHITNSPVKDAFAISMPLAPADSLGRMSWDQTAVLVGIRGHEPYYSLVAGRFICAVWGGNDWDTKAKGHFYLTEKMPVPQVEKVLNDLMMHQPAAPNATLKKRGNKYETGNL